MKGPTTWARAERVRRMRPSIVRGGVKWNGLADESVSERVWLNQRR